MFEPYRLDIDGHDVEFRVSSMGSVDPWSLDHYHENDIPIIGTSDIKLYCRVDSSIYRFDVSAQHKLFNGKSEIDVDWDFFSEILNDCKFVKRIEEIGNDDDYWKKWK